MWNIWKEELYKIASRKIIWLGVFLLLAFVAFRLFAEKDNYTAVVDGEVFYGREAIRKEQELAKRYEGILTKEKIKEIYDEYGFYLYDEELGVMNGNYCSRFISEHFTNYMQTSGNDPNEIHFYQGEEWERNVAPYLENGVRFGYVYGWNDLTEIYMMAVLVLYVILMIGLSPVFAEEYQLKTADILRTTRRGKQGGIWMKILAAVFFAVILTCLVTIFLWGIYLIEYGVQGLDASAVLLNFASFYGYCPETVLGFLVFIALLGVVGAVLLTGLVVGISASSKTPFLALVISLVVFLFPVAWVKVFAPLFGFGVVMTRNITHFMTSMPVYLPMSTGFAFSGRQMIIHLCIAVAVGTGSAIFGYHKYRNA